jgi:type VI protein secretion system component VasK
MEDPISNAEPLLTRFGADQINARTRAFCGAVRPLLAKLPFNPGTSIQASLPEVSAVLRPGTGMLWTMYNDVLQNALPKQGTQYAPAAGNVRLSPSFVALFNRLATFSDALFAGGAQEPHLAVTVAPQRTEGTTSVALMLEGDVVRTAGNVQTTRIDWPGVSHDAKLSAQFAGATEVTLVGPYAGPWSLFQLFYDADSWQPMGPANRAEWTLRTRGQGVTVPGGPSLKVAVDVSPSTVATVLRRGFFAGAECVGEVAR